MLPREADATEHLDAVLGALEERGRGERAGDRRAASERSAGVVGGPSRVPRDGARLLEREQHVGTPVLHALELTDRPAELLAHLRVLRRRLDAPRRAAGTFRRDEREREVGDRRAVGVGEEARSVPRRRVDVGDAPRRVDADARRDRAVLGPHDVPTAVGGNEEQVGERRTEHRGAGPRELRRRRWRSRRPATGAARGGCRRRRARRSQPTPAPSAGTVRARTHGRAPRARPRARRGRSPSRRRPREGAGRASRASRARSRTAASSRGAPSSSARGTGGGQWFVTQRRAVSCSARWSSLRPRLTRSRLTRRSTAPASGSRRPRAGSCRPGRRAGSIDDGLHLVVEIERVRRVEGAVARTHAPLAVDVDRKWHRGPR